MAEAQQALDAAAKFFDRGGRDSEHPIYRDEFLQEPWFWMCWAATRLKQDDFADRCHAKLRSFRHTLTDSGLVKAPFRRLQDYEADFYATALLAKAALLRWAMDEAAAAGESLLRALEANKVNMARKHFNMRWNWSRGFIELDGTFYRVAQDKQRQHVALLGLPAIALFQLAQAFAPSQPHRAASFRVGASRLLNFLEDCTDLAQSPGACSVLHAAALGKNAKLSARLQFLKKASFLSELREEVASMDEVAESLVWLSCDARSSPTSLPTTQLVC